MKLFCWHLWARPEPSIQPFILRECAKCSARVIVRTYLAPTVEEAKKALAWLKGDNKLNDY